VKSEHKIGKLEDDVLAGHLLVDSSERVELVFNIDLLTLVQMNFDQPRSIQFNANTLANNLGWKAQILEDRIMHRGESTTAWTFLLVLSSRLACWFGQDAPVCDEDNVLTTELLLEFSNQSRLYLLVVAQLWYWHGDHDSFLVLHIYLLGAGDAQLLQVSLQVTVHLEFQQSLRNRHLKVIRLLALWF